MAIGGPAVDWQEFEIVGRLRAMLEAPFLVENDANLAALAHAWRGDARGLRDFVTVVMGTGIGAAVVANGRLVKGRHNAAGELGFLLTSREQLRALRLGQASEVGERPGGYGGLEKVAAGPSIASRARALVAAGAASSLAGQQVTPEALFAAAAAGDPLARGVIDELLDHTAMALAAITAIVDPEVIILDGSIGRSLQPYLAELSGRLAGRLLAVPRLCISGLGPNATVVGAIAAALQLARERTAPSALFGAFTVSRGVKEMPEACYVATPAGSAADAHVSPMTASWALGTTASRVQAELSSNAAPVVAVDLGATHMRVAITGPGGFERLIVKRTAELARAGGQGVIPGVLAAIQETINSSGLNGSLAAIGVAVAAYVDPSGVILQDRPFGIPAGGAVRDRLSDTYGIPVVVDNDANLAAVAEVAAGAGRGLRNVAVITLGTNSLRIFSDVDRLRSPRCNRQRWDDGHTGPTRPTVGPDCHAGRLGEGATGAPAGYALLEELAGGAPCESPSSPRRGRRCCLVTPVVETSQTASSPVLRPATGAPGRPSVMVSRGGRC